MNSRTSNVVNLEEVGRRLRDPMTKERLRYEHTVVWDKIPKAYEGQLTLSVEELVNMNQHLTLARIMRATGCKTIRMLEAKGLKLVYQGSYDLWVTEHGDQLHAAYLSQPNLVNLEYGISDKQWYRLEQHGKGYARSKGLWCAQVQLSELNARTHVAYPNSNIWGNGAILTVNNRLMKAYGLVARKKELQRVLTGQSIGLEPAVLGESLYAAEHLWSQIRAALEEAARRLHWDNIADESCDTEEWALDCSKYEPDLEHSTAVNQWYRGTLNKIGLNHAEWLKKRFMGATMSKLREAYPFKQAFDQCLLEESCRLVDMANKMLADCRRHSRDDLEMMGRCSEVHRVGSLSEFGEAIVSARAKQIVDRIPEIRE